MRRFLRSKGQARGDSASIGTDLIRLADSGAQQLIETSVNSLQQADASSLTPWTPPKGRATDFICWSWPGHVLCWTQRRWTTAESPGSGGTALAVQRHKTEGAGREGDALSFHGRQVCQRPGRATRVEYNPSKDENSPGDMVLLRKASRGLAPEASDDAKSCLVMVRRSVRLPRLMNRKKSRKQGTCCQRRRSLERDAHPIRADDRAGETGTPPTGASFIKEKFSGSPTKNAHGQPAGTAAGITRRHALPRRRNRW
jgi:hypothetical protein